jgi:hypothetical protein
MSHVPLAAAMYAIKPVQYSPCQVAEHCWDPVGHAIATYGYLFEGLIQARQREV